MSFHLSACSPSLMLAPVPTPQVISIYATPAMLSLQPLFTNCADQQTNIALLLNEIPASAVGIYQDGVAIRWGAVSAPKGFAAVLGNEELAFVVHPQNPLQQISISELKEIYLGVRNEWPNGGPGGSVIAWSYPSSEDIQQIFSRLTQEDARVLKSTTSTAPDPQAMLEAVAANPQAIGFLPRRWLTSEVKEISILGISSTDLRRPVLAITHVASTESTKEWLLCVQSGMAK